MTGKETKTIKIDLDKAKKDLGMTPKTQKKIKKACKSCRWFEVLEMKNIGCCKKVPLSRYTRYVNKAHFCGEFKNN